MSNRITTRTEPTYIAEVNRYVEVPLRMEVGSDDSRNAWEVRIPPQSFYISKETEYVKWVD